MLIPPRKINELNELIKDSGMRVSMHPGQYTVINSPKSAVVSAAEKDLEYHAKILDALGINTEHKIVLHMGGTYGDKEEAKKRFVSRCRNLKPALTARLVIENDDRSFNIGDVLESAEKLKLPVIYDNLHNAVNRADDLTSDVQWIKKCKSTWREKDGPQKIHYSQQNKDKRPGAHSETIKTEEFIGYYQDLPGKDIDIMLEVKDKNMSAVKCINCVSKRGIKELEKEWGRYKYLVLEHSPAGYQAVRNMLKDKKSYPAVPMYLTIENSMDKKKIKGDAVNAAQHVWGYFKNKASENEKNRFEKILQKYLLGGSEIKSIKKYLLTLSKKYCEDYLLEGYYLYK
ncbi:MAG TPA: UV DNA damage repair endonuclease UvsE [Bacillota bacterium]|nr:UV DNA damage repair endonuclease UvsE [Bacillota bacterium]